MCFYQAGWLWKLKHCKVMKAPKSMLKDTVEHKFKSQSTNIDALALTQGPRSGKGQKLAEPATCSTHDLGP